MRGLTEREAEILRDCVGDEIVDPDGDESEDVDVELCVRLTARGLLGVDRQIVEDDEYVYEYDVWTTTPLGLLALRLHDADRMFAGIARTA